ncbi:HNH endonuclease [Azospirillum picis]|uniref:HNH endonuclease n=2 Tax=Azospirillum picis TaxID=488438 RepID=UPI001AE5023D
MSQKRSGEHINAQKKGKELDASMCLLCQKVDKSNHGHHLIYHSEGGSASTNNIVTLCPECHRDYHAGRINVDLGRF